MTVNEPNRLAKGGTVAVLAFVALLVLLWFVGPASGTNAQRQNRPQAQFPSFSLAAAADVTTFQDATAAFSDRLRAKPSVVEVVNTAVLSLTGRSPSADVVAAGDQLYYAGEFTEPCLEPEYATWARDSARTLVKAAQQGGRQVLFVVVPSKSAAHPPTGAAASALLKCQRWSQAVLRDLANEPGSPIRLIDPADVERVADGEGYWHGDTHWTPRGGQALSDLLAAEIGASTKGRFVAGDYYDHQGDLYRLLGIPRLEKTLGWGVEAAQQPQFEEVANGTPWPIRTFTSPQPLPESPSLLMVYDSFVYASGLEPSVASLFPSGALVLWDAMPNVSPAGPQQLVVLETTDRLALSRLASLNRGGPNQPFLDYLAKP
ncbi:MAG: hypothetical protein R2720_02850 [Candidatus Nanopelagicales bacterium]